MVATGVTCVSAWRAAGDSVTPIDRCARWTASGRPFRTMVSSHGISRLGQVRSSRRELMAVLTDEWSEEDRETFCRLLTRFNSAMQSIPPSTDTPEVPAS